MAAIQRIGALSTFACLGDACEDTCCMNWSMQVGEDTVALYKKEAPELLDALEQSPDTSAIMRKDPQTNLCVKLEGGLCGIHKQYGDRFLGDACHFYPRVTRALGDKIIMTATMSCPETARLALTHPAPYTLEDAEIERLQHTIKNCLPEGLTSAEALAIHQAFLNATHDDTASPEQIFLRIASASRSLERIDVKSWPSMAPFYLQHADTRIPPPERKDADPFNLLHALCGLIIASHKPPSSRLKNVIATMEKALAAKLDWEQVHIHLNDASLPAYRQLQALWCSEASAYYAPVLRRWLEMQMSLALYPFAGMGDNLSERISIIGVRFATVKLAFLCAHASQGSALSEGAVVTIIQSLSRFLDHLGDPKFSLQIYSETGWTSEARMHGLLL